MTHPATVYSLSTRLLHWSMAFCFIGAIVLAYFVIWVLGHDHPQRLPVLNLHWVLGLLVGLLLVPRIVSRLRGPRLPRTTSKAMSCPAAATGCRKSAPRR